MCYQPIQLPDDFLDQIDAEALYRAGVILNNNELNMYEDRALAFLHMAAAKDHICANEYLGTFYITGLGISEMPCEKNGHNLIIDDASEALGFLQKGAEHNNVLSLLMLGNHYIHQCYVKNSEWKMAANYYRLAADLGSWYAYTLLGWLYSFGAGTPKSMAKALYNFEIAAKNKEPNAICSLGFLYAMGIKVKRDPVKAVEYFLEADRIDDQLCCHPLGICYALGLGVDIDIRKSADYFDTKSEKPYNLVGYDGLCGYREFFEKYKPLLIETIKDDDISCSALSADMHYFYGILYEIDLLHGYSLRFESSAYPSSNMTKALVHYQKAAQKGHVGALKKLAQLYDEGDQVEKLHHIAFLYYEKAAKLQDPDALYELGNRYFRMNYDLTNHSKAINCYLEAARLGSVRAQYQLGYFYEKGTTYVAQDSKKAICYYQKAADQKHLASLISLGMIYLAGITVKKNVKKALEYFLLGAEQGSAEAQVKLGYCYSFGKGVTKDLVKAIEYYHKAGELGLAEAWCALGFICFSGCGIKKNQKQAVAYFFIASELHDKYALFAIGKCLASGQGVQKDTKLAEEYLCCAGMIDPVWGKENYIGFDAFCRGVMGRGGT